MKNYRVRWIVLFLVSLKISTAGAAVNLVDTNSWKLMMSGFVEMDMSHDTTRGFTEMMGLAPVPRAGTLEGDNGRTQFSVRNTRFAFSILPPTVNDWKTKGYIEYDLRGFNPNPSTVPGATENSLYTNPTLRMRHAYFSAEKEGWQVLAGQYWSLFSWNPTYVLTTVSIAPVSGSTYRRTPQVTVIKTHAVTASQNLMSALSLSRPTQRDSEIPNLTAGLRWTFEDRRAGYTGTSADIKAEPMSIALSGAIRQFQTPSPTGGTNQLVRTSGSSFSVDAMIPLIFSSDQKDYGNTLSLAGEYTKGQGYGDDFPNWTGGVATMPNGTGSTANANLDPGLGGFNGSGNFELIKIESWNMQLQYHLPQHFQSFVSSGMSQFAASDTRSLLPAANGPAAYNGSKAYFINFVHDVTPQIRVAGEYVTVATRYVDGETPKENRYQVSGWFRF